MGKGLLVSVRDADEAEEAIAGGAAIIDVKEPTRGAMGRPDDAVIDEVVYRVAGRRPISVAFGELRDWNRNPPGMVNTGVRFIKLGTAGFQDEPNWRMQLRGIHDAVAGDCHSRSVAVAYADWHRAFSPTPHHVIDFAIENEFAGVLIDTYEKNGLSMLDYTEPGELEAYARRLREARIMFALAGSLGPAEIDALHQIDAWLIGVRGSACANGSRTARVDRNRVAALVNSLRSERQIEVPLCETPL